jgi:hypothetical protein
MLLCNGWNCLRTSFCPALRRKKSSVSFCFKESWHNPPGEISNIKNASLYRKFFFELFLLGTFQIILPAVSYFALFSLKTYHINITVQLLLLADIETSQYTNWYGIKIHTFLPHGLQHMEFGRLSQMPFYSTPKQYLKQTDLEGSNFVSPHA